MDPNFFSEITVAPIEVAMKRSPYNSDHEKFKLIQFIKALGGLKSS